MAIIGFLSANIWNPIRLYPLHCSNLVNQNARQIHFEREERKVSQSSQVCLHVQLFLVDKLVWLLGSSRGGIPSSLTSWQWRYSSDFRRPPFHPSSEQFAILLYSFSRIRDRCPHFPCSFPAEKGFRVNVSAPFRDSLPLGFQLYF